MKQLFINLLESTNRDGIDYLLGYLETETDFYTAPASTKHHGANEGGLLDHSLAVYRRLLGTIHGSDLMFGTDSLTICSLLHDVCKANYYKQDTRNVKVNGVWEQVTYYTVEDQYPYGHGEKSVDIIRNFIELTQEEKMAIRWHMLGFDDAARGGFTGSQAMSDASGKYPLIVALHIADLAATYFDKK